MKLGNIVNLLDCNLLYTVPRDYAGLNGGRRVPGKVPSVLFMTTAVIVNILTAACQNFNKKNERNKSN
jgi:hypothetical protein